MAMPWYMVVLHSGSRCLMLVLVVLVTALVLIRVAAWAREDDATLPSNLRLISTRFGRVAIDEAGPREGRIVLIVPGTAGWSGFWRNISQHLVETGHRVVTVDLPRSGRRTTSSAMLPNRPFRSYFT